jgi:hypothetical protein
MGPPPRSQARPADIVRRHACDAIADERHQPSRQTPMDDTEQRALEAVQRLDYDFRQFTLPHFIQYLEKQRGHPIFVNEFTFIDVGNHAAWIGLGHADYIFYDAETHPVHQVHSILHECGHMVLGHTGEDLKALLSDELLQALHELTAPLRGRLRATYPWDDPQEREAEAFVRFLQREILVANRLEQLTKRASSIHDLARFASKLGYND